jgi:hypothetical protein
MQLEMPALEGYALLVVQPARVHLANMHEQARTECPVSADQVPQPSD